MNRQHHPAAQHCLPMIKGREIRKADHPIDPSYRTMSDPGEDNQRMLSQLRTRIDAIDSEMHRLLITRGTVIDALIKTKGAGRPGAAFRPAREAAMMRSLVEPALPQDRTRGGA